jgi:hypothetical protein
MKNLDYTSADLFSPIVDVKADILDLPLKMKVLMYFLQSRFRTYRRR